MEDDYDDGDVDGDYDWQLWTPCEVYGHDPDEYGWCADCGTRLDN